MKAAMTGMGSALRGGRFLASAGAFAALAALIAAFGSGGALAQNSADCARLQQAIASRHGSSGAQAAVERQRAELARTEGLRAFARLRKSQDSCFSARIRRRNAASSTARSRACRPISPICRRAPAAAAAISSPATTPNASNAPPQSDQLPRGLVRRRRELAARRSSRSRWTPNSSRSITGGLTTTPSPGSPPTGAASWRMPAPTRFACALATAASFRFPIPAPGAAPTAWRKSAGPCAPTPTWRSIRFRSAERSKRPSRRPASPTPICRTPANSSSATTRAAPADARARAGRRRSPTPRRGTATRSTTSS